MATIKLQGNASGSGSVTLTAPNTNSARTITLPDQDIDFGDLGGAGSVQTWVNWGGEGLVAIRGSGNVSSVTDLGTGQYRVNYSSSFSNTNYSGVSAAGGNLSSYAAQDNNQDHSSFQGNKLTGSMPVFSVDHDGGEVDDAFNMDLVCVS
jgi:hypothetical protein